MAGKRRASSPGLRDPGDAAAFRGFRRARYWLWLLSVSSVALGAALHDGVVRSGAARWVWLVALGAALAHPLQRLLGFRCPRCGNVFLATGGYGDFFGLGRILWSKQCGSCALPVPEEHEPPSSGSVPESRPV